MAYSYLIKGGTLVDGSGFPMIKGDVAISGELIKGAGMVRAVTGADRVIDARGKFVMPGIIDITNHSDTHWTLFKSPAQESILRQGITTIIGGACGLSLAPLVNAQAIRGIHKWINPSEVNVNWSTQEEFFNELGRHNLGVNFGTLVGHGTLRRGIVGDATRQLNAAELESMKLLLRRSLDEGAMGLSLGLASAHGSIIAQDEIFGLAKVVAETGKVLSIHLRNEGRRLLSSVVEVINIARSTGVDIEIVHFKAIGKKAWADLRKALAIIRKVRADEKLSIWVDFFPYLRTGSLLYNFLPEWMLEGGKDKILALLRDRNQREQVLEGIRNLTLHYDNITIAEAQKDRAVVGKTIAELAQGTSLAPEEILIQLLIINNLGVTIFGKTINGNNIAAIAKEPFSLFGSDGVGDANEPGNLTHPRSFGAAPRFLDRIVKRGKLTSWEETVKKMTLLPAMRVGIEKDRGLIKKGFFADIVVFDPNTIEDRATYANPYQFPQGIEYVFVNGRLAVDQGAFTGAFAGKILRRG